MQQAVETGAAVVVGVNQYAREAAGIPDVFHMDPGVERQQIARVRAVRAGRSETEWRAALDAVGRAARGADNLVPAVITAVERLATLGEIADTLRGVFGEHQSLA